MHSLITHVLKAVLPGTSDPGEELTIPDGRRALVFLDGRPEHWYDAGRYHLHQGVAQMEVRLFPCAAPHQPFERSLLYVTGRQVGMVKNGLADPRRMSAWTHDPGAVPAAHTPGKEPLLRAAILSAPANPRGLNGILAALADSLCRVVRGDRRIDTSLRLR